MGGLVWRRIRAALPSREGPRWPDSPVQKGDSTLMKKITLDAPQVYEIEAQGRLSDEHADWFDGMEITGGEDGADGPVTRLYGPVADQAALHGILRRLYALGLPLLLVRHIPSGPASRAERGLSAYTQMNSSGGTYDRR